MADATEERNAKNSTKFFAYGELKGGPYVLRTL